ncbi:type I polyketide synthase [Neptuniibacter pectenicola]|uniref:Type I polyketide synthase n=1 Tax=Neptuniibacter pectenicola TaxID=1806669 RepID=A0ABU9TW01_9GAMM
MDRRIALVGYSFRLPQTSSDTFWQDLVDEKDLITEVESSRWSFDSHLHPDKNHPGSSYTFKAGSLGDISGFDAEFFNISPREAAVMDPQQRHLLEMSWEAIEHAGIKASSLTKTNTGVFFGISSLDYSYRMSDDLSVINSSTATGNTSSIASNRISYSFDLQGPSISMDTACSSAMVAFHQACQSILSGEASTALTGGISLHLHPFGFIIFSKASMLSPDGRCKVFDKSANGYVRSEGGGVFLLKDYDQAVADGDTIHAIVAASSVNTDGNKSGITIPSCHSQQRLMEQTYRKAGISPDQLDYLEAHGTGTSVGDPIETRAIGNALGRKRSTPLPIGSVKSNLGHLEPASAVASLVKALLILKHRAVPATISMKEPNPEIKFDDWNIWVVDKLFPLKPQGTLSVGINSFGFGGANAHVILQSDERRPNNSSTEVPETTDVTAHNLPLVISGRNDQALQDNAARLADFLVQNQNGSFYDVAWNYTQCKERHQKALLLFAGNNQDAITQLHSFINITEKNGDHGLRTGQGLAASPGAVFVYSGNGCQWETMGKALLESSEIFRQSIATVDQLFSCYADFSLTDEINGLNGNGRFEYTEIAQPALFAIQVGITEYLKHQGITPVAVTGHSVGEVAAAWACGALPLAEAVKVIYFRSLCQGTTKGIGAMTAAALSPKEATSFLQQPNFSKIHLAGMNSSKGVTLAGDPEQLSRLEALLESNNVFNVRLPLDYAFHSPAMDPIKQQLLQTLTGLEPNKNKIPFISTVTGYAIDGSLLDAGYWWRNIRKPVLFKQAIDYALDQGNNCFIEIGAHPVLRSYQHEQIRQHNVPAIVIPTFSRNNGTLAELNQCAAAALMAGAADMKSWFPIPGRRLELPLYAWQHEQHWHPVTIESHKLLQRYAEHPLLGAPLPLRPLHWENQLDTARMPWLADHKVGDSVVYPGAGFIELALNAAGQFRQTEYIEIEEFEILAPLILEEGQSKVVQTSTDPVSGDIKITSRSHTVTEQWTQNCKARAVHQTTGQALHLAAPALPQRHADFDADSHQQQALRAGLQYGPAFSAVTQGWCNETEVLAQLNLPESIADSADDYLLHPGILDSAIQLVIHFLGKELEQNSGTAFIPSRVGRILVNRNAGIQPTLARLKLVRKATHSLLTHIELFDDEGNAVAVLEEVRFKAIRLYKSGGHEIAFLNYHLTPVPESNETAALTTPLNRAISKAYQQQQDKIRRYNDEVSPLLESLMVHALAESLSEIHADLDGLDSATIESLNLSNPSHSNLRRQLLLYAAEYGIIENDNDSYTLNAEFVDSEITSKLIWNTLVREYPDYFSAIHLAGRTSLSLTQNFLSQNDDGQKSSRPDSSQPRNSDALATDGYQHLFKELLTQTCYSVMASALKQLINEQLEQQKPGQRLRILEVASGQCHYGHSICSELNFNVTDYTFASSSESALESVAHLRERYPRVNSFALDQAVTGTPYQLAIVTFDNYLPTQCLQQLQQIKPLLAKNATVLICGMQPTFWLDIAFGSNSDWWQNEESVQASAKQWLSTLDQQHFTELELLSEPAADSSFFLISSTYANEEQSLQQTAPEPHHWLIIGGSNEKEQDLANRISSIAPDVAIQPYRHQSALKQQVLESEQNGNPVNRIILLDQMGSNSDPLCSQTLRCTQATELLQVLEETRCSADIWLITEGVGAIFPCDQQITSGAQQLAPADAAIWGFGRTLMNESLNNSVHLIDLPAAPGHCTIDTLLSELQTPSNEQELIITAQGERFAPRLRTETAPSTAQPDQYSDVISLGFELPGQLRNLHWQARPARELAADEVEIEVMATGLNFRDIMYALGLLSDEAIENGFAGATMGLEFSGRITRTGPEVTNFNIGDEVVGFGSSCFSNRMIATSYSIAPIPAGLSYEGAATIPTTFLTVYYALHHLARLQPGEKVLIHGAAGGVGIAAIQIAQWLGADIYATVGSKEKQEFLELMGIPPQRIYNSRELTFAEQILRDTEDGKGVDVVLNSLAGEAIKQNFRVLKPFGRFLELGKRDFYENTHIGLRPFRNNISYFGIDADQLQQELPELTTRLFGEMLELFNDGTLFPLPYTKFNAHQVVDAFRYMQQAKQIGKIIVTYKEGLKADANTAATVSEKSALELNPQATYLVTGGLGGFGLKTAEWLVGKGAKQLLLLSRRGAASQEAVEFLEQCQISGVKVHAAACDVTDRDALQQVIRLCGTQLPPLKGVVHAATLINDSLIRNLDAEQIETSLAAKLRGAQYLDELTRELELDMFVLYSSATTLLGNPGQAAYVAANHWLEALAATRQSLQLPASCVRWGAIDDVGFLARNEEIKDALQNRLGGNALSSEAGLEILEQMILTGSPSLGVMELDWHSLSRFLPTAAHRKFREIALTAGEAENSDEDALDLKTMMQEMSESEFRDAILEILTQELSEILMIPASKISPEKSIYDMGMDSLMGVELMSALESRISIQVPVMALTETPKLSQLTDKIIALIKDKENLQADATQAAIDKVVAQHGAADSDVTAKIASSIAQDSHNNRMNH